MEDSNRVIVSSVAVAISVGTLVLGVINHKRIRSNCCGRKGEASFDIDTTTPPPKPPPLSSIPPANNMDSK